MLTNRPLNNELRIFLVVILEYKSQRWSQLFLNQSGIVILNNLDFTGVNVRAHH